MIYGYPESQPMAEAWMPRCISLGPPVPRGAALTALGGLAEFKHELIRARTGEGRARAVERGVKMGRKSKLTTHQQREVIRPRDADEPIREIARTFNVSHSTISRLGNYVDRV